MKKIIRIHDQTNVWIMSIYTIKKNINVVAAYPTRSRNNINFDKPRLKQQR